jgi:hypothetical protein
MTSGAKRHRRNDLLNNEPNPKPEARRNDEGRPRRDGVRRLHFLPEFPCFAGGYLNQTVRPMKNQTKKRMPRMI